MGKISAARDLDLRIRTRWYVIANRVEAVIYRAQRSNGFAFVERLKNPEGKLTEAQSASDRPGRVMSSSRGSAIIHALGRKNVKHENAARIFARQISKTLDAARRGERFGELVVVAEPHFLGLLRKTLPASVKRMVTHEVAHEYAQGSDAKVHKRILDSIHKTTA